MVTLSRRYNEHALPHVFVTDMKEALRSGNRIISWYQVSKELRIMIITEADRSATTILLPEEY